MAEPRSPESALPAGRIAALRHRSGPFVETLRRSEMAKAAGLAGAMVVSNVVALITTLAFGRLLDVAEYGSLSALVSAFLILSVPGSALQAAVARQGALGRLGRGGDLAATLARWTRLLAVLLVGVIVLSVVFRGPIAQVVGVEQRWGAAALLPAALAWLLLSIQRGILQSLQRYRAVGISMILEQAGRLFFGVALVVAGGGVTGAYLGTPLAMLAIATVLGLLLHGELGPERTDAPLHRLRDLTRSGLAPILGLTLVAVLQNIDVIVAKHELDGDPAGAYAAAAVAAKVVIWVAIGIGFWLLPEATRRHAAGHDARPVLARALAVISAVALPSLLIFAVAPDLVVTAAFGEKYREGADALLILGAAMALLAVAYLAIQYLLALHHKRFLIGLGIIAVIEPVLLVFVAGDDLVAFATLVLGVQVAAAGLVLATSARAR